MDGVMSEAQAQETLLNCIPVFGHIPPTIEPDDEFERLNQRLVRYNCIRKTVKGDGNCVVRSISDQIHGTEEQHEEVRQAGVARLVLFRHLYEDYLDPESWLTYEEYVAKAARVYQDVEPLLTQAICDAYGVRIIELVSNVEYCIAEFVPLNGSVTRTIHLVSSERHSDSMYPMI